VERITETGVVVAGVEYEVDCIIYGSGFEVGTSYTRRSGYDMAGRDGVKLSEAWADGMRTMHGVHVHGFPNAFIVQISQGANLVSNVPHNFTESGKAIAAIIRQAIDGGHREVEVTKEAEDAWMELLFSAPRLGVIGSPDCTPGYYNNEGHPEGVGGDLFVGYPLGAAAYFEYLDQWRTTGDFAGLEFR
jgi:cyclohexanone monooxygenase